MDALASLTERLPPGAVSTHPGELSTHARDHWSLALLREARGDRIPPGAALVFSGSTEDVAVTLAWAAETGTAVVPRGGGSGYTGGAEARKRSVMLDLSRMNRILGVDDVSQTITAQAGARLVDAEAAAARHNLTLGLPSGVSESATMGGWVATGAGGDAPQVGPGAVMAVTAVLAGGEILQIPFALPPGGPARLLLDLVAGTEGSLAVVTEATVAASRMPASWVWESFGPHAFDSGAALAREVSQGPFRPRALALLDEAEALAWMPPGPLWQRTRPLLVVGFDAAAPGVEAERFELRRVARELGARALGPGPGEHWWEHRTDPLAWRQAVMGPDRALGPGVVVDTVDVSAPWRRSPHVYADVRGALLDHAEEVRCRLESAAPGGAALAFTFLIRAEDDRAAERGYREAWAGAVRASLGAGGSLARSQGVGLVRVAWVAAEVGEVGASALRRVKFALDPQGVLNPGKLIPAGDLDADLVPFRSVDPRPVRGEGP